MRDRRRGARRGTAAGFKPQGRLRLVIGALILCCGLVTAVAAQQAATPPAIPVGTVAAARKPVARTADFVGRITAINRVDVRARVIGYLEEVLFKEGDIVKEGQPLYRIEKDLFQAAADQMQGALAASQAKKLLTAIQYQRAEELTKSSAGTVVARDQALTADRAADAQILIDKANLETAKINLGYTDIVSPIAGKIGLTKVTKGNVVGPDSGVLTTIVSQDPIYVLFPISQRGIMQARRDGTASNIKGIKVTLRFADGTSYPEIGQIDFVDVTVDKSTDTVQVRAVFPNPKGALIDGQLATVNLESDKADDVVVVPQAALISDQQGIYVLVVEDGKVAMRRIKTGGASGDDMIVTQGLNGGEPVIIEGLQLVRPGLAVIAKPLPPALGKS